MGFMGSFVEIICGDHLWRLFVEIIYGDYLWRSFVEIICGDHLWRSFLHHPDVYLFVYGDKKCEKFVRLWRNGLVVELLIAPHCPLVRF
jgi:hypothetical protein